MSSFRSFLSLKAFFRSSIWTTIAKLCKNEVEETLLASKLEKNFTYYKKENYMI